MNDTFFQTRLCSKTKGFSFILTSRLLLSVRVKFGGEVFDRLEHVPLTSVRRSLNTLKTKGVLSKTDTLLNGAYGRQGMRLGKKHQRRNNNKNFLEMENSDGNTNTQNSYAKRQA